MVNSTPAVDSFLNYLSGWWLNGEDGTHVLHLRLAEGLLEVQDRRARDVFALKERKGFFYLSDQSF